MEDKVKPIILVAEDDAGTLELIRTHLRIGGYDVHTACTGIEALGYIRTIELDAMVLDINMPELDGFGVLEAIRKSPEIKRMPILVLTARHAAGHVQRAVKLGAKDYLAKPFSEGQLLARVARLLRTPFASNTDSQRILLS